MIQIWLKQVTIRNWVMMTFQSYNSSSTKTHLTPLCSIMLYYDLWWLIRLTSSWSGGQVPAWAGKLTSVSDASLGRPKRHLTNQLHQHNCAALCLCIIYLLDSIIYISLTPRTLPDWGSFISGQPILLGTYYPNNNNNKILLQRLPEHIHIEPQYIDGLEWLGITHI